MLKLKYALRQGTVILSVSYRPWIEGGCLSPAKLRPTDSVNPGARSREQLPARSYSRINRAQRAVTSAVIEKEV